MVEAALAALGDARNAAAAHRRPRHRLGRIAAGAASRAAGGARRRHRYQRRRARLRRSNAEALGLAGRAAFVACDHGAALGGGFDLIVANPPYVASGDIAGLEPEVRDFDPRPALDGGADGLAAYRAIVR